MDGSAAKEKTARVGVDKEPASYLLLLYITYIFTFHTYIHTSHGVSNVEP